MSGREVTGAVLAELAVNQPFRVLGKAIHREMSDGKHSTTELSKGILRNLSTT